MCATLSPTRTSTSGSAHPIIRTHTPPPRQRSGLAAAELEPGWAPRDRPGCDGNGNGIALAVSGPSFLPLTPFPPSTSFLQLPLSLPSEYGVRFRSFLPPSLLQFSSVLKLSSLLPSVLQQPGGCRSAVAFKWQSQCHAGGAVRPFPGQRRCRWLPGYYQYQRQRYQQYRHCS